MSQNESNKVQSKAGPTKIEIEGVFDVVSAFAGRSGVSIDSIEELTRRLYNVIRTEQLVLADETPAEAAEGLPLVSAPKILAEPDVSELVVTRSATPAIAIERAVTEDQVFCLCCGKGFTMLKRHLGSVHGLSEAEYRQMFDLQADFPLVAPKYSKRKAEHARSSGLGKYARETVENTGDSTL